MVLKQGRIARQPEAPLSSQQHDFYSWLRRIPFDVLQELHKLYSYRRKTLTARRDGPLQQEILQAPQPPPIDQPAPTLADNISPPVVKKGRLAVLRRSIFHLIVNIFAIELFFDLAFLAFRFIVSLFPLPQTISQFLMMATFSVFIILSIAKLFFMLTTILAWFNTRFEIYEGEIRFKHGILLKKEKIYLSTYTQEVTCTQSLLGRIFNYGTIEIRNLVLAETVYLDSIPSPTKYVEVIKTGLPKLNPNVIIPL